jgi:hypothetical protein
VPNVISSSNIQGEANRESFKAKSADEMVVAFGRKIRNCVSKLSSFFNHCDYVLFLLQPPSRNYERRQSSESFPLVYAWFDKIDILTTRKLSVLFPVQLLTSNAISMRVGGTDRPYALTVCCLIFEKCPRPMHKVYLGRINEGTPVPGLNGQAESTILQLEESWLIWARSILYYTVPQTSLIFQRA